VSLVTKRIFGVCAQFCCTCVSEDELDFFWEGGMRVCFIRLVLQRN